MKSPLSFVVPGPCPRCGREFIVGLMYVNDTGQHMHTRYYCMFWKSFDQADPDGMTRCGWDGWVVPEPEGNGLTPSEAVVHLP